MNEFLKNDTKTKIVQGLEIVLSTSRRAHKCAVQLQNKQIDFSLGYSKISQLKMLPLWPSINPSLIGSLMNSGTSATTNEEQEISSLEQEQQNYLNLVQQIASDVTPIGKMQSDQNNEESDADSAAASDGEKSCTQILSRINFYFVEFCRSGKFSKWRPRIWRWQRQRIFHCQLLSQIAFLN